MPLTTVLIVDDFEPFRKVLRSMLEQESGLQIVGEASDGYKAIQKIEVLLPDLVLLDIGLPHLNGLQVARRVGKLSPQTRILFVSQEFSYPMVQEAFRLGVLGYVHKQRSTDDLLPAIEAVLSGNSFVSRGLSSDEDVKGTTVQTPRHEALYYSSDEILLGSFTDFIVAAQNAGNPTIVILPKSHLEVLFPRLRARGIPVEAAIERGSLIPLEVTEVLPSFMAGNLPDPVRFFKSASALLDRALNAAGPHYRVAACGQCAPHLLRESNAQGAIRLEQLWDQLGKVFDLDILCAYSSEAFEHMDDECLLSISAAHSETSHRLESTPVTKAS